MLGAALGFFSFININYNIFDPTVQNFAKVVDFHCADAVTFFHSVYRGTADIVFCYQGVCCYTLFFQCIPKRLIAYQMSNHLYLLL